MKPSYQEYLAKPTVEEMNEVFALCRDNHWNEIFVRLQNNPFIALTPMVMVNHISSTVLHQAITSRGVVDQRAAVVRQILSTTPQAAAIRNGYGSLPLHVIAQRNTKMAARVKEELIGLLIQAHPQALLEPGGVGRRTPLHIIFTDYISPRLTQFMIDHGASACAMKDKKGWLPAHVACSRHCSPEKLHMLLKVYPEVLHAVTEEGHTLLSLAQSTATESHPNYALIDMLQREIDRSSRSNNKGSFSPPHLIASPTTAPSPPNIATAISLEMSPGTLPCQAPSVDPDTEEGITNNHSVYLYGSKSTTLDTAAVATFATPTRAPKARRPRPASKRSYQQLYDDPVGLLLHLSQSRKEDDDEGNHKIEHVEV